MRQGKTTGYCSTTVLKHFPHEPIPPWLAPAILTCFTLCPEKASHLGDTQPRGCSPGLEGLKMLWLDGTRIWKCGAETKQTHFTGCWAVGGSSRDLCGCQQSCSAVQGHPSWLLALFATLISVSEAEAVLELHEKKCPAPSVATPGFLQMCPAKANTLLQSETTSGYRHCVCAHRGEMLGCATCGAGQQDPPAPPWVQIQPVPPCCPAPPIPFLRYPGFASGCLSSCPCHCHRARSDHIFFYSL